MTDELMDIYRRRVLEHSREPHNRCQLHDHNRSATGFNPLCGDKLTVYLRLDDGVVADAAFEGTGCAICVASASMLTDALAGLNETQAQALVDDVNAMFTGDTTLTDPRLDDMRALENVRAYPSRIKCATLAWHTAAAALHGDTTQVTTE